MLHDYTQSVMTLTVTTEMFFLNTKAHIALRGKPV